MIIVILTATQGHYYISVAIFGHRPAQYPTDGHRLGLCHAMTDGACMSWQPRTFSDGGMHLAIVDDILCLRVDDATEWPSATRHPQMTVQDGDMVSEDRK